MAGAWSTHEREKHVSYNVVFKLRAVERERETHEREKQLRWLRKKQRNYEWLVKVINTFH